MQIEFWPIEKIVPAAYNPRRISDEKIETLKESITKTGFIIPILVNKKNNTIVAGHQRTKTAALLGIKTLPVNLIEDIDLGDEIRFNQIHNSIDLTLDNRPKLLIEHEKEKFIEVPAGDFEVKTARAASLKEICSLMIKYGNCLSCVVCKGDVMYGAEYVKACQILKKPVKTFIANDDKYADIRYYINQDYGQFCYDNVERHTYVQGLAQTHRDPKGTAGPTYKNKSWLYARWCIPYCKKAGKGTRVLDFGCGKGDYIPMMNRLGFPTIGMEFYNNNGAAIDSRKGNKMCDKLIEELQENGLFDVAFCSSVMNSVDSLEAEDAVMTCLNLFSKDKVFFSGRTRDYVERAVQTQVDGTMHSFLKYLDADGFTATYRKGHWYFQKFHTREQVEALARDHGLKILKMMYTKNESTWYCYCKKIADLPEKQYRKAVNFEFGLVLPNKKKYNREEDVWNVVKQIYHFED